MPRVRWKCECGRNVSIMSGRCRCGYRRGTRECLRLVDELTEAGFNGDRDDCGMYKFGNDSVLVFFAPSGAGGSGYVSGTVAADNRKAFNKLSQCALLSPLPRTKHQMRLLFDDLRFLSTRDGYRFSNKFGCIDRRGLAR